VCTIYIFFGAIKNQQPKSLNAGAIDFFLAQLLSFLVVKKEVQIATLL
jgi:hypothetical protein